MGDMTEKDDEESDEENSESKLIEDIVEEVIEAEEIYENHLKVSLYPTNMIGTTQTVTQMRTSTDQRKIQKEIDIQRMQRK